ncbi:MAG: glycerate kinase [Pseudomonadota bacterium]
MFDAAVSAALPVDCLPPHLPKPGKGRTIVIGAGKASALMAKTVEENWPGALEGIVVTRYGHGVACDRIEIIEASHPVPDAAGEAAAARILDLATSAGEDDLVLALISGGGSSLLSLPAPGLSLADKQAVNQALLKSGASIDQMNCVRKHLSAVKGGRLGAACYPARLVTLTISDVPGDDPSVIASGPTVADPTTFADALGLLVGYGISEPVVVLDHVRAAGEETPKPGDRRLEGSDLRMIATPQLSLEAAARVAEEAGVTPLILGDAIEGESRQVARVMAGMAKQVVRHGQPVAAPCVLISGGETTVTVSGDGRGGRNVEFALALALELEGLTGVSAIAADTDGVDGAEDVAGAIIDPDTLVRARDAGLDAADSLRRNDGHGFFEAMGDQVITGPTLTNVNDFRAILVDGVAGRDG